MRSVISSTPAATHHVIAASVSSGAGLALAGCNRRDESPPARARELGAFHALRTCDARVPPEHTTQALCDCECSAPHAAHRPVCWRELARAIPRARSGTATDTAAPSAPPASEQAPRPWGIDRPARPGSPERARCAQARASVSARASRRKPAPEDSQAAPVMRQPPRGSSSPPSRERSNMLAQDFAMAGGSDSASQRHRLRPPPSAAPGNASSLPNLCVL
jgi:hypothetical protein